MLDIFRIKALFLRHLFPLRRDFDLISDMIYWPIIDTILWGVTGQWIAESSGFSQVVVSLLFGLVLWNVIWRSQSEVSRNLMDEIWNNNLTNLFSTSLTLREWVASVLMLSLIKTSITIAVLAPLIYFLYQASLLSLGFWLIPMFVLTAMTGWWVGFISASIVISYGPKMQTVVWTLPAVLLPFSSVYFPVERLPAVMQPVAMAIPTTHVFEFMRALVFDQAVDVNRLWISLGLNVLYLALAVLLFNHSFKKSLELGLSRFN